MNYVLALGTGGNVDLYSQKEPYSGRGFNASCDAFGPGDQVDIYALVTYNDDPVQSVLVSFAVQDPTSLQENITISRSAITDSSGVATFSFRVPYSNESKFGLWKVVGNAKIGDYTYSDVLWFRSGWIVQILSVRTIDENYVPRGYFSKNGTLGLEVNLSSISFTPKIASVTIAVNDSLNIKICSAELDGVEVPPNDTMIRVYFFLTISLTAQVGTASVAADAFTDPVHDGGIPYCPEAFTSFEIVTHDITILQVKPLETLVYEGETVRIDVTVANRGSMTETFNTRVLGNNSEIANGLVVDLPAHSNRTLTLSFETAGVGEGTYKISASIDSLPGETNIEDNTLEDGYVEVKTRGSSTNETVTYLHDVAVLTITDSSEEAYVGDNVTIYVAAGNLGNSTESFNVTVFCGGVPIGMLRVSDLRPQMIQTLTFEWNTLGLQPGTYGVRASATVVMGEVDIDNNHRSDGSITLMKKTTNFLSDWDFLILLLLLLLILLLAMIIWWLAKRRKKKEKVQGQFDSAWNAWYYGYNLKGSIHRRRKN